MEFPCTGCGLCCKRIGAITADPEVFRGVPVLYEAVKEFPYEALPDGSCSMLSNDRCTVYEERPLLCNVKKLGELHNLDRDSWYAINAMSCNTMIKEAGLPEEYLVRV